ncbi:organic cation transporter protein-like [Ornithodoros turicata]|uniref:organic cation transporter protein-like n=1 Tax=Ornithodoros turicata TaxID=34597 RepID=UPI003139C539
MASIDDLLVHLGPWHYGIMIFCFLRGFPTAYHAMAPTFAAPSLHHWCARPPFLSSWDTERWKARGIPLVHEGKGRPASSGCEMYIARVTNGEIQISNDTTVRCSSWEYDLTENTRTLTDQFDLVCDRIWLRAASQSLYMVGVMAGSFFYAHISDWYGRKTALTWTLPMPLVAGFMSAFAPSFEVYIVGRILASFGFGGLYNTGYTLMIECVAVKHRAMGTFLVSVGWTCGLLVLVGFAWVIRDWFYLQITISLVVVINLVLLYFITESPRWLLAMGKFKEARKTLNHIIATNKIKGYSAESIVDKYSTMMVKEEVKRRVTFLDLFRPSLRWSSVIVTLMGIFDSLVYFNQTYSSILLGRDPYLSFALTSLSELPGWIASVFFIRYVRRRTTYMTMYAVQAAGSAVIAFITDELWWLQLCFAVLVKLGATCTLNVIIVQISEIYPTEIRTLATGFTITGSTLGAMAAPFVKELGVMFAPWIPRAVDVVVCLLLLFLGISLPESFNAELLDTMER